MSVENTNSLRHTSLQPKTGIVHLGLGVFFWAHAAHYLKEAIAIKVRLGN